MNLPTTTASSLLLAASMATLLVGCNDNNNGTTTDAADNTGTTVNTGGTSAPQTRFKSVTASPANGGGEVLIDSTAKLSWINDTSIDSRGDGCVSPGAVGPIEPAKADELCKNQQFAGFTDWRAPTAAELSGFITNAEAAGVKMKYLNPVCPAVVGTDGFVRTENSGNPAVATVFPNSIAGEILKSSSGNQITTVAGLTGVPAGLRCVRNGTEEAPTPTTSRRFESRDLDASPGGETLVDNTTKLEWVNDTARDSNGDGCVNPAISGTTEPTAANARCVSQNYADHNDWRAPTAAELTTLTRAAISEGQPLKYLNPLCPALVGSDGIVRTENANANAAAAFPTAQPGDVLGTTLSVLPAGVSAGVRCVRDL